MLRPSSSTRPSLWLLKRSEGDLVVKDYRSNGFLFRNLAGRFLVWRELKALRRLRGVQGVPDVYGAPYGLAVVMEAIAGRPVEGLEHGQPLPLSFFDGLRRLIDAFHVRGVAHCDLKRAPNILLGDDGNPYVVDWSASILASEFRGFPLRLIYRRFLLDDLDAVVKLQLRHRPEEIDPLDLARYQEKGRLEKAVRSLRDRARELLQRLA